MGHETGADRLCLRLPALVTHRITAESALAHWNEPGGILQDADSEIVVVVPTPCTPFNTFAPKAQQEYTNTASWSYRRTV